MRASALRSLWRSSPPLTATGVLMLVVAVATVVAAIVDPRSIAGAPAWLKPLKFAMSTAIYSLTLAWVLGHLRTRSRLRGLVAWTTAGVFVLEVAIIDLQAWRGTTSHFNASSPLDATLFAVMGIGIGLQTLASVWVAVMLWRQPFTNRVLGSALRWGMTLTIAGALVGPLMTMPTGVQLERARAGLGMPTVGAHTVGAPDGGAGLPVTGWSREYGDLRIPHFVGLHAIQVLGILALLLPRLVPTERRRLRLLHAVTASYGTAFLLLLAMALRGDSPLSPSAPSLAVLLLWGTATTAAVLWVGLTGNSSNRRSIA